MAGIIKVDRVQSDSNLAFQVAGANVAFIDSTGLTLTGGQIISGTNTLINSTGLIYANAGIKFPATQVSSSDVNTLDDYEEGTWTPTDGSGAGLTLVDHDGIYTKIGRVVFIQWRVTYPSTASASTTIISGLPFQPAYGAQLSGNYTGSTGITNYGSADICPMVSHEYVGSIQFRNHSNNPLSNANMSGKFHYGYAHYIANF